MKFLPVGSSKLHPQKPPVTACGGRLHVAAVGQRALITARQRSTICKQIQIFTRGPAEADMTASQLVDGFTFSNVL